MNLFDDRVMLATPIWLRCLPLRYPPALERLVSDEIGDFYYVTASSNVFWLGNLLENVALFVTRDSLNTWRIQWLSVQLSWVKLSTWIEC